MVIHPLTPGFSYRSWSAKSLSRCVYILLALAVTWFTGCAHRQLERNTALAATTVNSIQYRMVLDNIAMMSCEPANLPSHVRLADGTVQISNQAGVGEAGGFSLLDGSKFVFEQFGPAASTKISEQWGTDAVEDPLQVFALQSLYRKALGLEPLEEPNFIKAGRKSRIKSESSKEDSDNGTQPNDELTELDAADFDIPTGWFSVGCKQDVPKNACYVGLYRDRYAWVVQGDVPSLATFTLAVLTVTKLAAGEANGKSGLMFTP